jgi:hypothetical protein
MVTKRTLYSWVLEKNVRWQLLLVLLVVLTVGIRVVPLEMQKRIINQAIGLGDIDLLVLYCLLFLAACSLASALKFAINLLQAYIGQRPSSACAPALRPHPEPAPVLLPDHPARAGGQLPDQRAGTISGFIGSAVSVPLINVCTLLAMGGYLFYLNPLLAGLSFVLYPLQIVVVPAAAETRPTRPTATGSTSAGPFPAISARSSPACTRCTATPDMVWKTTGFPARPGSPCWRQRAHERLPLRDQVRQQLLREPRPLHPLSGRRDHDHPGHFDLGALVAFLSAYTSLNEPWREMMDFYQLLEDSRSVTRTSWRPSICPRSIC